MIGASPRLSSSTMSSFGGTVSARPMASICCSPPESSPARRSISRSSAGKYSQRARDVGVPACGAEAQVLGDGQLEEQRSVLGDVREAGARDLVRGPVRHALPEHLDVAGDDRQQPRHRQQRRRLAGAVRSEQHDDLAAVHREREVADDGDAVVAGRQAADLEADDPSWPFLGSRRAEVRLDHVRVARHLGRRSRRRSGCRTRSRRCSRTR